ncbi:DUF3999 family protein [Cognatilysobacter terrigena]|uniref:DUF3999 family protein n=1 Tax=Cognatilysobacter terrigena TaxID=2488749 RepID=UPI00105FDCA4|nr:DUF3999 family protein [Lysobacter terrigena]
MKRVIALLLTCTASLAIAAGTDYARQWPVVLHATPADAYAVELTPEVYATVQRADLRDLDVLDASGRPVPVDLVAQAAQNMQTTRRVALPWYRMPAPGGTTTDRDWRVMVDVDTDGRLRVTRSTDAAASPSATTLLIDATSLRTSPSALELAWRPGASFDAGYRIEGSNDLDRWYDVGRGRLVDVHEDARRLQMHRLEIATSTAGPRFLRLVPDDASGALPDITGVDAVWTSTTQRAPVWRRLTPKTDADGAFEFDVGGRYPVRWIDLDTAGNDARAWRLQSRDTLQAHWNDRSSYWVAYRVGSGRSSALVFDVPVRDRYWRLVPQSGGDAPSLKVGYLPERAVFIAGGRPPYTLVAGSLRAVREQRPVQAAIGGMSNGVATARLAAATARSSNAALAPARDWKTWGLWAVLGLGVLAVGGFALHVLREPPRTAD